MTQGGKQKRPRRRFLPFWLMIKRQVLLLLGRLRLLLTIDDVVVAATFGAGGKGVAGKFFVALLLHEELDVVELATTFVGFEIGDFGFDEFEILQDGDGALEHEKFGSLGVHDEGLVLPGFHIVFGEEGGQGLAFDLDGGGVLDIE